MIVFCPGADLPPIVVPAPLPPPPPPPPDQGGTRALTGTPPSLLVPVGPVESITLFNNVYKSSGI